MTWNAEPFLYGVWLTSLIKIIWALSGICLYTFREMNNAHVTSLMICNAVKYESFLQLRVYNKIMISHDRSLFI